MLINVLLSLRIQEKIFRIVELSSHRKYTILQVEGIQPNEINVTYGIPSGSTFSVNMDIAFYLLMFLVDSVCENQGNISDYVNYKLI